jgi:hypothetical protein
VRASSAYTLPPSVPKKTIPLANAAELLISWSAVKVHRGLPVSMFTAWSLWSHEPA